LILLLSVAGAALAQESVAGEWLLTNTVQGIPFSSKLVLKAEGGKLEGELGRTALQGTVAGDAVHFTMKPRLGNSTEFTGKIVNGTLSGTTTTITPEGKTEPSTAGTFTARRIPQRPPGPPRRHEFVPKTFYREFSSTTDAALHIWPGDTVHTMTVDAGGQDEHSVQRVIGGNPQTGPFYIETAMPGDVIAVHLNRIRLNRDWAISDDQLVGRALGPQLHTLTTKDQKGAIRWKLDRERGLASPETPSENLKNFTVPVRPMLGCIAIAPSSGSPAVSTRDSGGIGGNMDFNEIVEGTTVYFRIAQPGALLYIGDGHAVQGDGELTGNALETSMEVEFTVDVLPGRSSITPRVESPTHRMAIGLAGSLDEALREATFGLVQWLQQDYKLNGSEVAQILGTAVEYRIAEIADRSVGVVAKISRERLAGLVPSKP
jgi:acetamidase/formamidase